MALREDLQRRIERKQEEIREFELKIREGQAYIQGLQDTLKMLPRESPALAAEAILRPGTSLAKAREAIRSARRPLHISDLLKAMGREVNKENRAGLGGSIAAYVRRNEVFTRPAPNTFGLIELGPTVATNRPPDDFGKLAEEPDGDSAEVNE